MTARLPDRAEANAAIRVAIVRGPETDVLADSIEELLADAQGFTFSRIECHSQFGVKPDRAGFGNPDVVVATLGAFQETNTDVFLSSLQQAFPHRSVLVTTTDPDTFDFFRVLEMGASDFMLPPLRRSELLPRLMRQAKATCDDNALVQKLKENIGLKQIIGESPAIVDKVRSVPRFARCDTPDYQAWRGAQRAPSADAYRLGETG